MLKTYEKALGQKINTEKIAIVVSQNVKGDLESELSPFGILAPFNNTISTWAHLLRQENPIKEPSRKTKLGCGKSSKHGRKSCYLKGEKSYFLKQVALSIPTYVMSCFKLLNTLCTELESLIAQFWWGQEVEEKKIYWIGWKKLCKSKFHQGMGFKSLNTFNLALLAKHGWCILNQENSLLHKVFKVRYFPKGSFFEATLGSNPSFTWRGIWKVKKVIQKGCRWRISDGCSMNVWPDSWTREHCHL